MRIISSSKSKQYKMVKEIMCEHGIMKYACSSNSITTKLFSTAKECALQMDVILIKKGKNPINVLKRLAKWT